MANNVKKYLIGFDVGSTTVKAVVVERETKKILWCDYQRHETKQPEKVYSFLERIEKQIPDLHNQTRVFCTGSGGSNIALQLGGKFVQEVNAVSLAVEEHHPDVGSVIELGGQDAKIIVWQIDPKTKQRRKLPSMNDKCAGGTGAVIDKICAKLKLPNSELLKVSFRGTKLHPVAGKCGVFAETDINGLQKQGVPADQLMASLFEAIVQQNLSVLTRGNTLMPKVLLLGGPNTFIPAMVDAWKVNIPKVWAERKTDLGGVENPEDLIIVPKNAEYYAALGSVLYGLEEPEDVGVYAGIDRLKNYIQKGRTDTLVGTGNVDPGLVDSIEELHQFAKDYTIPSFQQKTFERGEVINAWLGVDGGSTSTKAVLINEAGELIAKHYTLSQGNPIADAKDVISQLKDIVEENGATLQIRGFGTTGYAKDMLKETLGADVALVETVAHAQAALHYYKDTDVIVDVGGQDIKVMFLNNGNVKDFKLNTQCSAGNGYFLQSTAAKFGVQVEQYADTAFTAKASPIFSYGCAVFMESDIVNFQRMGWQSQEIMSGLAKVLPKNIWLYVVQEPNLKKYGTKFVLQGGTQRNLAAVKSQVDYIKERVPGAVVQVHKYCGESGAIGCALEALALTKQKEASTFIGFDEAAGLTFSAKRDESTRCYFCKNKCLRTFIDTQTTSGKDSRFIIATCEKGTVTDVEEMKKIRANMMVKAKKYPNLVAHAAKRVFETFNPPVVACSDPSPSVKRISTLVKKVSPKLKSKLGGFLPESQPIDPEILKSRGSIKIAMPRVLNMYSTAPFFRTYFEALGVKNIIWSDYTSEKLYKDGAKRGSIDQCFPSKVSVSHIHNLLFKKEADVLFFPTLINLKDPLTHTLDSCACPTVQSAPNVCKAAFTKEKDLFQEKKVMFLDPPLHMNEPNLVVHQMFTAFKDILQLGEIENEQACQEAWKALDLYKDEMTSMGRDVLRNLVANDEVGVVMIGRPYHNDPGLNHEIMDELQQRGFPVLSMESLPDSDPELYTLFAQDLAAGKIKHPKDITDVFGNAYSTNSSYKMWCAKYASRHPNLAIIDLSSFKCGHDAPIYHVIEGILQASQTPFFTFHDIDENKPAGSIKIRVETMEYTLRQYARKIKERRQKIRNQENDQLVSELVSIREANRNEREAVHHV